MMNNMETTYMEQSLKPLKIVRRTTAKENTSIREKVKKNVSSCARMTAEPDYKFNNILQNEQDAVYPFFYSDIQTNEVYLKNKQPKLDFTTDVTFYRNVVKKYTKPVNYKYIPVVGGKRQPLDDPVLQCFTKTKQDSQLQFGDYLLNVSQSGAANLKYEPLENVQYSDDEVLYRSDEGEVSRLENSDLDNDSEADMTETDGEDEMEISLGPSNLMDADVLTPSTPRRSVNNHLKTSPKRQETLLRTLANKSPIKRLTNERLNKSKHMNYSKFDSSMCISAKAIMKMVDDSLVSSDTEIYNQSYTSAHAHGNPFNSLKNVDFSINASDLISALNDNEY